MSIEEIEARERHLSAIRLPHRPVKSGLLYDTCGRCDTYWPCDAAEALAELKEAWDQVARLEAAIAAKDIELDILSNKSLRMARAVLDALKEVT